jgi:hypothetical protein
LLHDSSNKKKDPWWKIVTIERILESMKNDTNLDIVYLLMQSSEDLKKEMQLNIPTLIRSGNHEIAKVLLREARGSEYEFSREHEECL